MTWSLYKQYSSFRWRKFRYSFETSHFFTLFFRLKISDSRFYPPTHDSWLKIYWVSPFPWHFFPDKACKSWRTTMERTFEKLKRKTTLNKWKYKTLPLYWPIRLYLCWGYIRGIKETKNDTKEEELWTSQNTKDSHCINQSGFTSAGGKLRQISAPIFFPSTLFLQGLSRNRPREVSSAELNS